MCRAAAELHINYAEADDDFDWQRVFWERIGTDDLVQKEENIRRLLNLGLIDPRVFPELSEEIRRNVAENPNTPVDGLVQLSSDEDSDVRQAAVAVRRNVAKNRHTRVDVLVQLSTDGDSGVRKYVAQNPNTPVDN
jgi:hypothetical protein